ncbi:DUF4328 domain-containing protein [Streptomyces mirabilis]|uniref:DUF4328 domain-containing protein n=1 Tax=Streptomyces mirabilis TaxID=68239 RepID=UPI003D9EBA20
MINFFVPRQIVLDIERASSASWAQERDTTLVNLWWVGWITHALVLVGGRVAPGSMAFTSVRDITGWMMRHPDRLRDEDRQ